MHEVDAIQTTGPSDDKRTSTGVPMPRITPLTWATAREVLPHEAHDFTPWLAENLDLLADALGLDDLALVAREWDVETFSLDLLAVGSDLDGDIRVAIESQYGATDHRHLGQLLTYATRGERWRSRPSGMGYRRGSAGASGGRGVSQSNLRCRVSDVRSRAPPSALCTDGRRFRSLLRG